jgi:hypothetical protein
MENWTGYAACCMVALLGRYMLTTFEARQGCGTDRQQGDDDHRTPGGAGNVGADQQAANVWWKVANT